MSVKQYQLKPGDLRLQVLVTQRCNAVCLHCDKAVGYSKLKDIELTPEGMRTAVAAAMAEGIRFTRVSISGGEPLVNKHLQEIINEVASMPGMRACRVLSNALASTQEKRDAIVFPDKRFGWALAPLDDPTDPKSGKNQPGKRCRDRVHLPYWVSPADIGRKATFAGCGVRKMCGRGFDNNGFSMCGQAPILGRLLGVNPYQPEGVPLRQHINTGIEELCKHCVYGLPNAELVQIGEQVGRGELPMYSPTFVEAFKREPKLVPLV